jgi:8-oxo-dGTP pyrophosphatase MutT (NUDIX family)
MPGKIICASVCFLRPGEKLLLGRKTRKVGAGLFNAPGGIIEKPDINAETRRELQEEIGVRITKNLEKRAVIDCHNYDEFYAPYICRLFVSFAEWYDGKPTASEEFVDLRWCKPGELPLNEMMAGDRDWMPRVAAGELLVGDMWYTANMRGLERDSVLRTSTTEEINRLWIVP